MKKTTFIALAALAAAFPAQAKAPQAPQIRVENVSVEQHDNEVSVSMVIDAASLRPGKDREYTLTPTLFSPDGTDSVRFEPVTVAGHNLYYLHDRQGDLQFQEIYHAGRVNEINYSARAANPAWIDSADLVLAVRMRNCCDFSPLPTVPLGKCEQPVFDPIIDFGDPIPAPLALEPKTREIDGRAYINFPVNRTELYPDYMNNPAELRKIIATIDSVKNDSDITVDSIFIKGYASPEGPYDNNIRLAKGRTATLKDYVERMYAFPKGFINTSYEPEDWAGLREYVESSNMLYRKEILEIIDSDLAPDPKNSAIQRRYPTEYSMLLKNVYPELRHSDYSIFYTIRTFTDPAKIIELTTTAPQKLSEQEITYALSTLTPGSAESNYLYETAARMFPDNKDFCFGAAVSALSRDDYKGAEFYLNRAGDSARVAYTRAVIAARQGDLEKARTYYRQAENLGSTKASAALRMLQNVGDGKFRFVPAKK